MLLSFRSETTGPLKSTVSREEFEEINCFALFGTGVKGEEERAVEFKRRGKCFMDLDSLECLSLCGLQTTESVGPGTLVLKKTSTRGRQTKNEGLDHFRVGKKIGQ